MDVPFQIHRWSDELKGWKIEPVKYEKLSTFAMWDFLDPLTNIGKGSDYKEIRWDLLRARGIVFYNGGTPRIKRLNSKGLEKGVNIIDGVTYPFSVNKIRAFDKTIMNNRYGLVGVITLQGVSPTGEGGSHYVAYFLGGDQKWYYYNDLTSRIVEIKDLPNDGVWVENNGKMPSMYFYQKIA